MPEKQKRALPGPAVVGIVVGAVILILVGAYCGLCAWVRGNGCLLPGVQAQDGAGAVVLDLGGAPQQEAVGQLAAHLEEDLDGRSITLRYGDGERVELSGSLLTSNPQAAVEHGMQDKAAQPFLKLGLLWMGLLRQETVLPLTTLSFTEEGEAQARQILEPIAQQLYVAPVEFSYELGEDELTLTTGVDGQGVDVDALLQQICQAMSEGKRELTVETQVIPCQELNGEILAEAVRVEPQASQVLEDGTITPTVVGVSVDPAEAQEILNGLGQGETCTIPVIFLQPDLSESEQYLYQDLLSTVTTNLDGVYTRSYNVALSASSCNGVVVMPGQIFSYLGTIGNPSTANGYKMSTGYANGETVDMVGGGICQVSSSIYYCTVYANLEIISRAAHAFTTGYIPNGLDATVYYPSLDYKFRNNSEHPIKIVAYVSGNRLTVSFYGTKTDDTYVQTQRYTVSTTPWGTVYQPDPTVPQGTTKVKTTPYTGYEVDVYRCVYDGDGKLISRTYENHSRYAKRDRVILFNPVDAPSLGLTPEGDPLPEGGQTASPEPSPSAQPTPSTEPTPSPAPSQEPVPSVEPTPAPEVTPSSQPAPSAVPAASDEPAPSGVETGG